MATFQVKTPRTPEGAERRASKTFIKAIEKYQQDMYLDEDGNVISNTVNDKDEGIKISLVPCYGKDGLAREGLAILDVQEYASTKDQKHELPEARTTYLFDSKGNICEVCYSDQRRFDEYQNPYYQIYDDKRLDNNLVDKFEKVNTAINASFLDSMALSLDMYEYNTDVIVEDIQDIAYPTLLKTYIHERLDGLVEASELEDVEDLDLQALVEVSDKISELDDEELIEIAEEEENEQ